MYRCNKISLILACTVCSHCFLESGVYSNCLFLKNKLNCVHIYVFNNSVIYMMRYSFFFSFYIFNRNVQNLYMWFYSFLYFSPIFLKDKGVQGLTNPPRPECWIIWKCTSLHVKHITTFSDKLKIFIYTWYLSPSFY